MLSATLQLCVRILPAKGIPTRRVGRNSLISSFPDDRIARKPERNRNFTRDRSRSFNLAQAFFLFPSFFFFFFCELLVVFLPNRYLENSLEILLPPSFANVSVRLFFRNDDQHIIVLHSDKFVRSFGLFEGGGKRNFSPISLARCARPNKQKESSFHESK